MFVLWQSRVKWNLSCSSGLYRNLEIIIHLSQILSRHALGKRQEKTLDRSSVHHRFERVIVNTLDWDAPRCRPTITDIMCCQVAWQFDRWYWYFTLANHKTHTQQGGSVFAGMILQQSSRSLGFVTEPGVDHTGRRPRWANMSTLPHLCMFT